MVYHAVVARVQYAPNDAFVTALTKMGSEAVRNGERQLPTDLSEDAGVS